MASEPTAEAPPKFEPRAYIAIFFFRWKFILLCLLVCLNIGVCYTQFAPKKYLTTCTVMVARDPHLTIKGEAGVGSWRTYTWMLQSDDLHDQAIEKLKDEYLPEFGTTAAMKLPVETAPERGQRHMIKISIKYSDRKYAEKYLAALWEAFQEKHQKMSRASSEFALAALDKELQVLRSEIEQADKDLVDFARKNAMEVTDKRSEMELRYLVALLSHQNQLRTEIMLIETEIPIIAEEDASLIAQVDLIARGVGTVAPVDEHGMALPEGAETTYSSFGNTPVVAENPAVGEWRNSKVQLMRLEARRKQLLENFSEDHVEVKKLDRDIAELREQLRIDTEMAFGRLRDRHKALRLASDALETPIRTWQNSYRQANRQKTEYNQHLLVRQRREERYRDFYSRLDNLTVAKEIDAERFVEMQSVKSSSKPIWPDTPKIMLFTLGVAIALGFGGALLLHMFDNRMQTIADVEKLLGIPFLGGVPQWASRGGEAGARPIVLDQHASGAVEAYRAIRTSVIGALEKAGQKIVLFTSAESKEGKTMTALNFAVMLAQVGKKVLLVDMDLRRPRLHRSLGAVRSPGAIDALREKRPLLDCRQETMVPGLSFVAAGNEGEDVAELLQATDLVEFFAAARREFDYVVLDTSPVLRATDTSIIASPELCSVIYVAHVDRTPKPLIQYSLDLMRHAHILGAVMNSINMTRISSIYYAYQYPNYAYYAYAYAYGYEYDYYYTGDHRKQRDRRRRRQSWQSSFRSFIHKMRQSFLPLE